MNGVELKVARVRAGLTQRTVAEELRVSTATLNRWEKDREVPEWKARAYLDALRTSRDVTLVA